MGINFLNGYKEASHRNAYQLFVSSTKNTLLSWLFNFLHFTCLCTQHWGNPMHLRMKKKRIADTIVYSLQWWTQTSSVNHAEPLNLASLVNLISLKYSSISSDLQILREELVQLLRNSLNLLDLRAETWSAIRHQRKQCTRESTNGKWAVTPSSKMTCTNFLRRTTKPAKGNA